MNTREFNETISKERAVLTQHYARVVSLAEQLAVEGTDVELNHLDRLLLCMCIHSALADIRKTLPERN